MRLSPLHLSVKDSRGGVEVHTLTCDAGIESHKAAGVSHVTCVVNSQLLLHSLPRRPPADCNDPAEFAAFLVNGCDSSPRQIITQIQHAYTQAQQPVLNIISFRHPSFLLLSILLSEFSGRLLT